MNEKVLIERIQNGDESALDSFIEELYPTIFSFLNCRMKQDPYANDLTQEVFLQFMKHVDGYQNQGKVKAYLYTIAINLSNTYFRKRNKEIIDDDFMSYQADTRNHSQEFIMYTSNQMEIKKLMDTLSDEQKMVVWLRYYENAKFEEIATILQIPKSTAKSRLRLALAKMREEVKKEV